MGRWLRFSIEDCTVKELYDVYWRVRNAGEKLPAGNHSERRNANLGMK
jgi:hypothetical protein